MGIHLDIDYVHGIQCIHVPEHTPGFGFSPQENFLFKARDKLGNNCVIVGYKSLEQKLNELDNKIQNKELQNCTWENKYNECSNELNRLKITIENKESEIKKWKIKYNECLKELNLAKETIKNKVSEIEKWKNKYNECSNELNNKNLEILELGLKSKLSTERQKLINEMLKQSLINTPEINKYTENIKELIEKLSKKEELKKNVSEKLENIIKEKSKIENKVNHLNIVLVGKTGVGKTTLINKVLEYDKEESLETSFGKSCTMGEPQYYTSKKVSLLRLADSRGIEIDRYGIEQVFNSINNFITQKLENGISDEFVHCIWYCITGTRLEDIEINTLKKLANVYKSKNIPIIMVYTQALSEGKQKLMENFIKENCNFQFDFIAVLAKKERIRGIEINPFGIDKLIETSILRAKEAVKTTLIENCIFQGKQSIKDNLKIINTDINSFIEKELKNKLKIMNAGKSIDEISDDLKNLLFSLICNNFYLKQKNVLSNESLQIINEFSNKFISDYFNAFNIKYDNIKNKIISLINGLCSSNSLNCNSRKIIIEKFITEERDVFFDKMWMDYAKKLLNSFFALCGDLLKKNSENIYNEIPETQEFKDFIDEIAGYDFDEIKNNLNKNQINK